MLDGLANYAVDLADCRRCQNARRVRAKLVILMRLPPITDILINFSSAVFLNVRRSGVSRPNRS